jgi:serine/threonine-protein kinase RsbW
VSRLVHPPVVRAPRRLAAVGLPVAVSCWKLFPGTPEHVAGARAVVRCLLAGWPRRDDAVLVASELASNAVVHTRSGLPGGWFGLEARRRTGIGVWIAVRDQGAASSPLLRRRR